MRACVAPILASLILLGCGEPAGGDEGTAASATTTAVASTSGEGSTQASSATTTTTGDASATSTEGASTSGPTTLTTTTTTSATTATATTATTATTGDSGGGEACVDDHRVVAYVANWQDCPTPEQMAQWSHVVVAFAVSYMWTPNGNVCDQACTIGAVPGCNGKSLAELASDLHAAGVKILVSFGGAGMGGVWEGSCGQMTKCWDACLDRVDAVVDGLVGLVADNDLDGVDIDYEYCLSDDSYRGFVSGLTGGLRAGLDALPGRHRLLTHAPMDSQLHAGDPYFQIVQQHAADIDFLMPQYYNGGMSPFDPGGLSAIETHYRALVDGPFGGDASRVVFGYCIEPGCNPVATQPAAVGVAQEVATWYPSDGGVFYWAHPFDPGGAFAAPFRQYYDQNFCGG